MNLSPDQFLAANKTAADSLLGVANAQFAMFEQLVSLHMKATRSAYEDVVNYVRSASSAKDPQELLALNLSAAQPVLQKAFEYSQEVYQVVAKNQGQFTSLFEAQTADMTKGVASLMDQYSKSGAPGSDVAAAALKNVFATASSAYDTFTKAAKQTSNIAQANFAAATSTAKEGSKKAA